MIHELPWATAAVFEQAHRSPEEPWLFFRPELDWRWRSWSQVAGTVLAGVEALADLEPGARVGFEDRLNPDTVAFDLAVQGSGRVSVPKGCETADEVSLSERVLSVDAWFAADSASSPEGASRHSLPSILPRWEVRSQAPPTPALEPGAVELWRGGGQREVWPAEAVAEKARGLPVLKAGVSRRKQREIVVSAEPLKSLQGQVLVAWSALTGAALLLEPESSHFRGTVQWSRPTVLAGRSAQLEEVRRDCSEEAERRPWWRRGRSRERLATPFDRVRAVWVFGEEPLAQEDLDFWQRWSVPVASLGL